MTLGRSAAATLVVAGVMVYSAGKKRLTADTAAAAAATAAAGAVAGGLELPHSSSGIDQHTAPGEKRSVGSSSDSTVASVAVEALPSVQRL